MMARCFLAVLLLVVGAGASRNPKLSVLGQKHTADQAQDDLAALDAAVAKIPVAPKKALAPPATEVLHNATLPKKAPVVHKELKAPSIPVKDVKGSPLYQSEKNFAFKDAAEAVLAAGDAKAKVSEDALKQKEIERRAPAKVVRVDTATDAQPVVKSDTLALEAAKALQNDMADLKERAVEQGNLKTEAKVDKTKQESAFLQTKTAPGVEDAVAKERMDDVYIHDAFGQQESNDSKEVKQVEADKNLKP